jgi:hypothetical protein
MKNAHIASRRHFLKKLLALGMLPGCGALATLQQALAQNSSPLPQGIVSITGSVTIEGRIATQGMLIHAGQTVSTGPHATLTYIVGNNAFLQRENSIVKFGIDALTDFMHVINGRILSVFGSGNKQLQTPTAVIGIRGTACHLGVDPDKTYLCLCYGEIEVKLKNSKTPAFTLKATHHDRPLYLRHQGNHPVENADMLDHQDDELKLLESLVGRVPPISYKSNPFNSMS